MAQAAMALESTAKYYARKDVKAILVILVIAAPLFCVTPMFRHLWSPDELRYAAITREMVVTGNWVVPRLNGDIYTEKPPLHFWLAALAAKLLGERSSYVLIIPSMLAALGCLVLTYLFGRTLFDADTALLSALILATSSLFLAMAQYLRMDMLLAFFIQAALLCFYQIYSRNPKGRAYHIAFYLSLALATLTKGPVGVVLPAMIIVIYLSLRRDLKSLWKLKPITGSLIFALIVGSWLAASVNKAGWEYLELILVRQNLVRAYDSWDHDQPFYFYIAHFPATFFPWFPFVIGAFVSQRASIRRLRIDHGTLFPVVWFAAIFIFFSLMSGKVAVYLLPLIPAASLLAAKFWHDSATTSDADLKRCFAVSGYAVWAILIVMGVAFLCGLRLNPIDFSAQAIGILFVSFGVAGAALWRSNHVRLAFVIIIAFMVSSLTYSTWRLAPILDREISLIALGDKIAAVRQNQERIGMYDCARPSLYYYTGSRITMMKEWSEVTSFLSSDDRVLCIIEEEKFRELKKRFKRNLYSLGSVVSNGKQLVIVSQHGA